MQEIKNPNPPIWFIVWDWDGEKKYPIAYGKVESDQWMTSGLSFLQTFENEQDYLDALTLEGITPDEL